MKVPIHLDIDEWQALMNALSRLKNSSNTYPLIMKIKHQAEEYLSLQSTLNVEANQTPTPLP